jgi:cbb3-type cytochrome oxidase subunit 3
MFIEYLILGLTLVYICAVIIIYHKSKRQTKKLS